MLLAGIGDTIRVSLTAPPYQEILAGQRILRAMGLSRRGVEIVSCPTCGRTTIDLVAIARQVEQRVAGMEKDITVAIMGCAVNGPGEARQADIGIAGGAGTALLFKKGEIVRRLDPDHIVDELVEEIEKL